MSVALLVTGVAVERFKIECKRSAERLVEGYHEWVANLPDELEKHPCTGDIICQRQGVRHRSGCIGKDVPFDQYAKALIDA